MTVKLRRIILRSCFVVVWIGALAAIFFLDRGHTVFVDNKNSPEGSPTTYEAVEFVKVSLDGGKGVEFFKGDRDRFPVAGAKHRIRVEFKDGREPIEREFSLPLITDLFLLSVPKMIAGIDPFVEPFHMEIATSRTADEAPPVDPASPAVGGVLAPDGSVVPGSEVLAPVAP
jgi:hypothetical protein